jgi:VWFA-related protein
MSIHARLSLVLLVSLLYVPAALTQQTISRPPDVDSQITLDVSVTSRSGEPVTGLQQQDFTLLDNKAPQPITSFQAFGGDKTPLEVILVLDAINTPYERTSYARQQMDNFLRANGGHLAHPTALAFFTDKGIQMQDGFSSDGNALSDFLDHNQTGLRDITRSSGFYGAEERLQLSINALHLLAAHASSLPGRKIVLWVSPGWALLSGPRTDLDTKQQEQIFATIVDLSTALRQARITLYSIDPIGAAEAASFRTFYYKQFLKGVSKPSQDSLGNLALQVLATQSGGLALNSSNDVSALLQKGLADAQSYYEISFRPAPAEQRNEYHHLEVRVAKPGLIVRTRDGYYAQP